MKIDQEITNSLIQKIQEGTATDEEKVDLYEQVKRACAGIAYKYQYRLRCPDEIQDLLQEGFFAVMDAAETYDPGKGKSFIGWLEFYLHRQFSAYVARQNGTAINARALVSQIERYKAEYRDLIGSEPSEERICRQFEITPKRLKLLFSGPVLSLDQEDENGITLHDRISSEAMGSDPEDTIIEKMMAEEVGRTLRDFVNDLAKDERDAIVLYYFQNRSSAECADMMGLSLEKYNYTRVKAIQHLRSARLRNAVGRLIPERYGSKAYRRGSPWSSPTERLAFQMLEDEARRQRIKTEVNDANKR